MAQRRCIHVLSRRAMAFLSTTEYVTFQHSLKPLLFCSNPISIPTLLPSESPHLFTAADILWPHYRHFSSHSRDGSDSEEHDHEEVDDGEGGEGLNREYSPEEKSAEAAAIGYTVLGPLQRSDRVFKPYEPVFAVVQIGSHQFKVSNGDSIFTERLKFCEVNDKLVLNKVLLLGSATQTMVGRPVVPDATVHAVVEEHALDAKVIIFKKKRRKNYRRTKGHRQELTKLRITDIQGIEKPETKVDPKPQKGVMKKQEKVAVAA
uniref:Large ribosomal subunit protein bL21m n=1 Tax=Rhizophora mucronata TaxID=61149 RepID=A0A2P2IKF4_RHIMU